MGRTPNAERPTTGRNPVAPNSWPLGSGSGSGSGGRLVVVVECADRNLIHSGNGGHSGRALELLPLRLGECAPATCMRLIGVIKRLTCSLI